MSEVIKAEVTVSKEAYELGLALGKIAMAAKKAFADGVQVSDAVAMGAAIMTPEVLAGLQGVELLGEEMKADKAAFVMAFGVAGAKLAEDLGV